jgi:hypothetical protein
MATVYLADKLFSILLSTLSVRAFGCAVMKKLLIIFVFLTLCVGIAAADIAPPDTCVRLEACVDGSDFVTVDGGQLTMVHHTYDPIGTLVDCREYPDYVNKVKIDGVFYDINAPGIDEPYTINGQPSLPVGIMTIDNVYYINGRGTLHFWLADHRLLIDDDAYSSGSMYSVDLCGMPTHTDSPEFPSTVLPVAMIIGILGTVLFIQRTREH